MITVIAYHPTGYEVRIELESSDKLAGIIQWLHDHNYRPSQSVEHTPEGLPICPKHRVPMTQREKQGDTWFSHNMGTKDSPIWCRGYASNASPGWNYGDPPGASQAEPEQPRHLGRDLGQAYVETTAQPQPARKNGKAPQTNRRVDDINKELYGS